MSGVRRGWQSTTEKPYRSWQQVDTKPDPRGSLLFQSEELARRKSAGCTLSNCHVNVEPMHAAQTVRLGCVDCHGGNLEASTEQEAHVLPGNRKLFNSSANPELAYTAWLQESPEFIRFVNPGDLRVLDQTCGVSGGHVRESYTVRKSMMATGGMLWGGGGALQQRSLSPERHPLRRELWH